MENQPQNPRTARRNDREYIDLLELGRVLLHWLWLIVIMALIGGAVAFCISKFVLPEQFQSTTKVYVLNKSDETQGSSPTYSDMQVSSQLTSDYAEMITSRYVLEKVIQDLNLPYGYEDLKSKVTVTIQPDTRIIQISVTDEAPVMAQKLTRKIQLEASKHIQNVMEVDAINVVNQQPQLSWKSASRILLVISAVLLGKELLAAVVNFFRRYYGERMRILVSRDLSLQVVKHILTFKMAFFTTSGNEAGRMRRPTIRRLSSQS